MVMGRYFMEKGIEFCFGVGYEVEWLKCLLN